jgi:hypothetical protein
MGKEKSHCSSKYWHKTSKGKWFCVKICHSFPLKIEPDNKKAMFKRLTNCWLIA